ncbi:uncharacterized protein LOC106651617 [Trichogramma pretiosum]|uniref:uncharacterized protein LOC106651617 n=1 Tax=Trichogramma pretiosum TaxID=7493 RepID=UPI0006C99CF2|nr:uncharacterized protein LOC106651617 [Trichogramma pretiosum]XP_014225695.1 uncharacterized protein LOC106651617 [Trichogramma pretiosum]XP_023314508.1 uncharacterized protein LOC106651617 [Trichogramma pretiosum]
MLSYMLPREEKEHQAAGYRPLSNGGASGNGSARYSLPNGGSSTGNGDSSHHHQVQISNGNNHRVTRTRSAGMFGRLDGDSYCGPARPGSAAPLLPRDREDESHEEDQQQQQPQLQQSTRPKPKPSRPNGHLKPRAPPPPTHQQPHAQTHQQHQQQPQQQQQKKCSILAKDDSLHSIESDASTAGSERKAATKPCISAPKHANLKRVSFGSSKGSMVETLVYETPVQEEPEINHFNEQQQHHNGGRLLFTTANHQPILPVPDTDEGREKVRVSLLGAKPFPSTPGVLLLEPIGPPCDIMAATQVELLTAHTDHTVPTYHTQMSTDSGWDNPFRPDGDLSREADEIVELIKGGKPITPTPGQNAPALPGYDAADAAAGKNDIASTQRNGNAHSTPNKPSNQQPINEKTVAVEVSRVTAQGPGDASQIEHVTLKKKPKCQCCVLQ